MKQGAAIGPVAIPDGPAYRHAGVVRLCAALAGGAKMAQLAREYGVSRMPIMRIRDAGSEQMAEAA